MAIIDEVRRRAAQARFEAERLVRINRTQTRISALQGQLNVGATQLGGLALDLIARGELAHPELAGISDHLLALRAHIEALDAEVRAIRAEVFTEEPTSITCPSCGTVSAPDGRFCRKCGTPLQAGRQVVQAPPAVQYPPAPVDAQVAGDPDIICERCAAANPPGMRFCVHCGARLPIGTAGPAAPAWSAGTPPAAPAQEAAPAPAPPSRAASREAPTVRMPTLDPALVADSSRAGPRTEPQAVGGSASDLDRPHAEPPGETEAPPEVDSAAGELAAAFHGADASEPGAEPAPATLPLPGKGVAVTAVEATAVETEADAPEQLPAAEPAASSGAQSVPVCPACGEPVVEGAAFCVTCGTRVVPA